MHYPTMNESSRMITRVRERAVLPRVLAGGVAALVLGIFVAICGGNIAAGDEWKAIAAPDLALKSNPANPGDHAMILYREETLDDVAATISEYKRIKIFDAQGKDYADIRIQYYAGASVKDLHARTILPNGTAVNFTGKAYDQVSVKAGDERVMQKTLALPDVTPGCIIEYRYTVQLNPSYYYDSHWDVQDDLFTRDAVFTVRPYPGAPFYTRASRLPQMAKPLPQKDGTYRLELTDIAALVKEDLMPPDEMLRGRIDFFYRNTSAQTTEEFWKDQGKKWDSELDKFANGHKDQVQQEVNRIIASGDSPDVKLQKLYERAQKIRNLDYEDRKTRQEQSREKLKDNNNAGDVLKNGYGIARDVNFLFVAMARVAGFGATEVYLAPRNRRLFNPEAQEVRQLGVDVVAVQMAGAEERYLDPACASCPYGLLPWYETACKGLRLDHDGGQFISTPITKPGDGSMIRHADLTLSTDGALKGDLQVDYTGLWAISMRDAGWRDDQAGREKLFSDDVLERLPAGSQFKLTGMTGWDRQSGAIHVQGHVEISRALSRAGHHLLLTTAVLHAGEQTQFAESERLYPVYYRFPFELKDEVVIQFPAEVHADSLPNSVSIPAGAANYEFVVQPQTNGLQLNRQLSLAAYLFGVDSYPALQGFFSKAHASDERQIVLVASAKP